MKYILSAFVFIITIFTITSCAGPYTIEDSGSTVNMSVDGVFEVNLEGNSSTGYSWQVVSFDSTVIKQLGDSKYEPKDDKTGSSGIYTYEFKTVANGETKLLMVYKRKWEEHKLHDKVFEMNVVVGTMGRILEE